MLGKIFVFSEKLRCWEKCLYFRKNYDMSGKILYVCENDISSENFCYVKRLMSGKIFCD
jgi:hypothetical protein